MFTIYWLISEDRQKTYVGQSSNPLLRIKQHKNKEVDSTKDFGNFKCFRLEQVNNLAEARKREKYWKSAAGRKKLKIFFKKIFS